MDAKHTRESALDGILFAGIFGFASGVIFSALHPISFWVFFILGIVVIILSFGLPKKAKFSTILLGLFFFSMILGVSRFDISRPDGTYFADSLGKIVSVEGVIEEPNAKATGQQFVLDTQSGVNIVVSTGNTPELKYGDAVTVKGTLLTPQNFMTDQGTEFDYISYLFKDDILYQIKNAAVSIESRGGGNKIIASLIPLKQKILESFHKVLPAKEADLLAGLDLGEKSSIDKNFRNDLVTTGTIHMIALSGYNVTIIANGMRALFTDILGLGTRTAAAFGAFGIIIFVVMTGLQSSALRAGVMALISIFARTKGRTYNAFRALLFAGFLMILWDPKYLVYDVSFQLSFLATLGIIFITPVLEQKFARVPKKIFWIVPIREFMSVTLGAQIGVLPFILFKMGTLSIISLPANMAVLPIIPYAMGLGALAGFIGMFSAGLALPISWITYEMLRAIRFLVGFFARVPGASVVVHNFSVPFCLFLYFLLVAILYREWNRGNKNGPA